MSNNINAIYKQMYGTDRIEEILVFNTVEQMLPIIRYYQLMLQGSLFNENGLILKNNPESIITLSSLFLSVTKQSYDSVMQAQVKIHRKKLSLSQHIEKNTVNEAKLKSKINRYEQSHAVIKFFWRVFTDIAQYRLLYNVIVNVEEPVKQIQAVRDQAAAILKHGAICVEKRTNIEKQHDHNLSTRKSALF